MARRGLGLSSCHVFSKDLLAAGEDMLALAGETSLDTFVVNVPAWAVGERYIEFAAQCRAAFVQRKHGQPPFRKVRRLPP